MEVSVLKKSKKMLEESRAEAITMAILEHEDPEVNTFPKPPINTHFPDRISLPLLSPAICQPHGDVK